MIELKEMHLRNFFSYKEADVDFRNLSGLVLIEGINQSSGLYGSNGSGKSTLLEGIVYALSGNTLRNVGVSDMVNRDIGKNTMCSLSILSNNDNILISRYRKDDKFGDSIVLVENGKDISSRLNKSTQSTIDSKLNIPYKVLTNTILLGEGLSSRFTQLSDPDKKSLIESTLSLSYDMNVLRDKANVILKELRLNISELNGSISSLSSMINSFNPSDDVSDEELMEYIAKRDQVKKQLDSVIVEVETLREKLSVLDTAKREYEILNKTYTDNYTIYSATKEKLDNLHSCDNPHCSLCGQEIKDEETFNKVKSQYEEDLTATANTLQDLWSKLSSYPEYDVICSKLSLLQNEFQDLRGKQSELADRYSEMSASVARLETSIKNNKSLKDNISNYEEKLSQDKKDLERVTVDAEDYDYIYRLFSPTGLINYILEEAISYINDRMTLYTEMLIDKSYVFGLSKGKLTLTDPSGSSYQSLSNGEKRRLDICIQFSLHDYVYKYCGLQIDSLFVDEVLDTLDSTGVDNIFEVLRIKMDYCNLKRVLVITHNNSLKDKFDKILTVIKDNDGFSYIK